MPQTMRGKIQPVTSWDDVPICFDTIMFARIVGKSDEWVRRAIRDGKLPESIFVYVGNERRFSRKKVAEWLDGKSEGGMTS